jgi:thiol:disulfide interchange protein/DsbC/DsbD-like thiol-disulfide interchange protein
VRFRKRLRSVRSDLPVLAVVLSLAGFGYPQPTSAQEDDEPSPHSTARLISEMSSIQPGTPFTVALHFELDPGWHNYWENAGDSGLPTTIEWTLPEGFEAGEIHWPFPERIVSYPLVDYGYSHEVSLLVEITPPAELDAGTSITLDAFVDWLICETICLPAFAELSLEIPVSSETAEADPQWVNLFQETRDRLPKVVDGWSLDAGLTDSGYRLSVELSEGGGSLPDSVYFYASGSSVLDHAAPQRAVVENGRLTLDLANSAYATQPTSVLRGVLVAEEGGSWDVDGVVSGLHVEVPVAGAPAAQESEGGAATGADVSAPVGTSQGFTLVLALVFAFFGGILLNLMPCVFPILSLKILGSASQGGEDRARIRNQGVVFGIGVVLAFLALGGLLIVLRAGGAQLGWGFQLQAPTFVAFMAALFFAIGLNLMGVFEVGSALTRVGGRPGEPSGYGESLASGVLATVIATPCTAPFMGAALGFALTRSIPETLLIFGFLGVGMAVPYLVLSLAPGLLERLPRPGPWMETLRQALAFPMFATVIWLAWVFGQQTGVGGATYLLSALLLVTTAGWMVGRWQRTDLRSGMVARVVSLGVLAVAALLVVRGSGQEAPLMAVEEGWLPFAQEEVERTLAQGRPVFVDFTAAWCLTCQVNERMVLSTETVQAAFRERNVALFKADWTRQDPEITAALEALDRSGVPVYALYRGSPGASPHLLPAILTEQIVLRALEDVLSP